MKFIFIIFFQFLAFKILAQNIEIKSYIINENLQGIYQVKISEKNSSNTVYTNKNGYFEIIVKNNSILEIKFNEKTYYLSVDKIREENYFKIVLQEDSSLNIIYNSFATKKGTDITPNTLEFNKYTDCHFQEIKKDSTIFKYQICLYNNPYILEVINSNNTNKDSIVIYNNDSLLFYDYIKIYNTFEILEFENNIYKIISREKDSKLIEYEIRLESNLIKVYEVNN